MSTADHVTCCCADTLAEVARLTAERDRARALAIRLEAEAAQPYLPPSPFPPPHRYPTPIIEWLASVGLDASLIPVGGARIVGRTPIGGCLLRAERLEQWRRSVEGQEGAESGPSRVADGLEGLDWHSRTPATGEARKSAESDADDDAEWDAREAIERARGGR